MRFRLGDHASLMIRFLSALMILINKGILSFLGHGTGETVPQVSVAQSVCDEKPIIYGGSTILA